MQVRETSIQKTSGFSIYFFHTLIKQRGFFFSFLTAKGSRRPCPGDMSSQVASHLLHSLIQTLAVNPAHEATVNHFAIGIG
jgi:hypothetical protein